MTSLESFRIGIDLDNTLIDYSNGARYLAADENIANVASVADLRDRFKHADNERWQFLQARLYTDGLDYATPADDSLEFMELARRGGIQLFVVSHKTWTTPERFGARNLRKPALDWLVRHGIVPQFIGEEQVFFCVSQEEKVEKVRDLELDWFIDDLGEVLHHSNFPKQTVGWLYAPGLAEARGNQTGKLVDHSSHLVVSGFADLLESLKGVIGGT